MNITFKYKKGGNVHMELNATEVFLLLVMLFSHIVDDFYLQGILASMKTRTWWKTNSPKNVYDMYKRDYIIALIMHAFSWSFSIMLVPAIYLLYNNKFYMVYMILYLVNTIVHACVDNAKANLQSICLIEDQGIHMVQILITWTVLFCIG